MRVKTKLIGLAGAFVALVAVAACGSTGGTESTGSGAASGCTPGVTAACLCVGGTMGVQTCKDDGRGFGTCECGVGTSSSSSSSTGSTSSSGVIGTCGDGVIQESDHCDNASSEFYCKSDCENQPDAGPDSGTGGAGGACAGHVYFAGKFDGASSVWANLPAAGGMTGLDAGNAQCKSATAGDHVCDYEEVLKAQMQGELATIAVGTTAWIHRTTVATVNGNPSQPGPGGRCNDWTYATNHISDGEYVKFDMVGQPTYLLDNDTVFDPANPGVHTIGTDLQCGGTMRSIFCCYTACE